MRLPARGRSHKRSPICGSLTFRRPTRTTSRLDAKPYEETKNPKTQAPQNPCNPLRNQNLTTKMNSSARTASRARRKQGRSSKVSKASEPTNDDARTNTLTSTDEI
ncbi:hypothetical protein DIPPA_64484, partial [Diplonema papillatum]